jgi:pseudouridine kinase
MPRPTLLAIGAAHIDRRGIMASTYIPAASNPGTMREEIGGGAFNALRNAVRHGASGAMLSLRGGDVAGDAVARALSDAGITDLSAVFLDRTTPSYTALLDADGELIAGFADMGLYDIAFEKQVRRRQLRDAIAAADAILCDANMPAPAIERLADLANGWPIYAIAISPAKVVRLRGALTRLSCLFMNAREARTLASLAQTAEPIEAARMLAEAGLARGVITSGGSALIGFDADGIFTIAPPAPASVADVTGAGDAIAGVTIAHFMAGMPLRDAVRRGMAAAKLTVESPPVVATYEDSTFEAALALVGEVVTHQADLGNETGTP